MSWARLGGGVEVLVVGEEEGSAEAVLEIGLRSVGPVSRTQAGTPLVSSIFALAQKAASHPVLAYLNADILLLDDFLPAVDRIRKRMNRFLLVGARWDLDVEGALSFSDDWQPRLREAVRARGRRHPPGGSDYFVFPREAEIEPPPFALGRAGWDNWMIYRGRSLGWPVVDASESVTAIHQNHDYSHLPGGQSHHRLSESAENLRLAGGRRTVFTLWDADWQLTRDGLHPPPWTLRRYVRHIETYPLLRWHSRPLAEMTFILLNPLKAWREWRGRAASAWSRRIRRRTESVP
ncbi:MAG: hypothetical protein WD906_07865 [Anaerolineales bacterium]